MVSLMSPLSSLLSLLALAQVGVHALLPRQTAMAGDRQCGQSMCITAALNGSSVDYILSSTGSGTVGWMAMGFGNQMPNTPMVIMWANANGSITLSQRSASGFVMPTVDINPPRPATLTPELSSTSPSTSTRFAFSIPANGDLKQNVIYAFGATNPQSAAMDAPLEQHLVSGTLQLDLTKPISLDNQPDPTQPYDQPSTDDIDPPLLPYQRLIVAHAIFCVLGFLLFLPAGALVGRYLRTFTPTWFQGHWIAQFALAGPTIVVGVALGIQSISKTEAPHLNDTHKRLGAAIFAFYILQCTLGAIIHWVKPKRITHRPPQNYFHAILGLVIIALALYQVRSGYKIEWPKATGRGPLPQGLDIIFWVWVALLPVAYGAGLAFLPKQYRQERKVRHPSVRD